MYKKENFRKHSFIFIFTLAISSVLLTGCFGTLTKGFSKKFKEKNYYTYVQPADPKPGSQVGIVVGQVTLGSIGSVFHVRRVGDGQRILHKVAYRRDKKVENRESTLIYAGALPVSKELRKELAPELADGGAVLSSLLLGSGKTFARSITMTRQYPAGWFVLVLPPGQYELDGIEGQDSRSSESNNLTMNTKTITTKTIDYSVSQGPQFTVQAGKTNYIGNWHYKSSLYQEGQRTLDKKVAEKLVTLELNRLNQTLSDWPMVIVNE